MTLNRFVYLLVSALPALAAIFQVQEVPSHLHDSSTVYDNVKVLRIPTGHDISKLESLISKYQLNIWTEHPLPNSHIDVEVPAEVYWNFTTTVNGILEEDGITAPMITMHEDLGESIRKESEGIVPASELKAQGTGCVTRACHVFAFTAISSQQGHWRPLHGSRATIPMLITWRSLMIWLPSTPKIPR